jgi:hypothetical protein
VKVLAIICFVFAAVSLIVESRNIINGEYGARNLLIPLMLAAFGLYHWFKAAKRAKMTGADDPPRP